MKTENPPLKTAEIEIEGLTSAGDGVGKWRGLKVFVPGALPGETVKACLTQIKKNYAHAVLLDITHAAATRLVPACPVYAACGGCAFQHLAYEEQLKWKRQWLSDALRRIGGLDIDALPTLPSPDTFFYRNRVQLHALWQNNQLKLGFYGRGSKAGEAIQSCLLMREPLNQLMQSFTKLLLKTRTNMTGLQHIALRCDSDGEQAMLILLGIPYNTALCQMAERLMTEEPQLLSVWANWGRPIYGIYGDKWRKLAGADKLPERLGNLKLDISPAAFTQVNFTQALRLYECVADYAALSGGKTLLDIYSGAGIIALNVARRVKQAIGVEEYAPAVADATRNAELNGIVNCRFEAGRAEIILPRLARQGLKADVAVLDPPRAGCTAAVVEAVAAMQAQRVVYVSCDPATLARDLRLFAELGYTTHRAQPLDMFPQTGHVESICLLTG